MALEVTEFFDEITKLADEGERQYGVANLGYTEYFIERLELCLVTCMSLQGRLENFSSAHLQEYGNLLQQLINCLRALFHKWIKYEEVLESQPPLSASYQPPLLQQRSSPGRPSFCISKDQLLYLSTLSFTWTEIAAVLNVSRMTIYRLAIDSISTIP